jgi:hypothetical protein
MVDVCNSRGLHGGIFQPENLRIFPRLGLHFLRFMRQNFGALHYTADRLNLQLCTCMVCLCYVNATTWSRNLFSLAFQQLKSIGLKVIYLKS